MAKAEKNDFWTHLMRKDCLEWVRVLYTLDKERFIFLEESHKEHERRKMLFDTGMENDTFVVLPDESFEDTDKKRIR